MLPRELIPTPLVEPSRRREIAIVPPRRRSAFRALYVLLQISRWLAAAAWLRLTRRWTPEENARRFRDAIEQIGGFWLKLGQILSLRRDIFSSAFCDELSRLQDRASGFPPAIAAAILEEELGGPPEAFFDPFEPAPIAAASIAQIHKARLRYTEIWVAIKVQRPESRIEFRQDFNLIRILFRLLDSLSILSYLHWREMLWELEQVLEEEIDYRIEASSIERMRETLQHHQIYVPQVFKELSTRRVLVMEFIDGVFMSDYIQVANSDPGRLAAWLAENRVNPMLVARRLYLSLLRQLFEDNLFHGDLHPGNIVLLQHSYIALIDFGTVGSLEQSYQKVYRLFVKSLVEREFDKAVDLLLVLSSSLPAMDVPQVKQDLIRTMRKWADRAVVHGLPYHQKSITSNFEELGKVMFKYRIWMDWSFLKINRTHLTLDASLQHLFPDVNYLALLGAYLREARGRAFDRFLSSELIFDTAINWFALTSEVPAFVREFALFRGPVLRRQVQALQGSTDKISFFFEVMFTFASRLTVVLWIALLYAFVHQYRVDLIPAFVRRALIGLEPLLPELDPGLWTLVLAGSFYLQRTFRRLRFRFASRDLRVPD